MATTSSSSEYGVLDVPYIHAFQKEMAPAFLDHVAILSGTAPPARQDGFTWCDLGCGQGVTAVMLAAMYPAGKFHGIDMIPVHVDHARRLANESRVTNATFHACDFSTALDLDLPQFDYIVAHGVYTWVGAPVQADLRAFIDRHLKPGGLVYVSYNALPGRAADLPLQRLVQALSEGESGNSLERVAAALQIVKSASELNARAIKTSPLFARINAQKDNFAASYLAHEFLTPHWEPLSVRQVRSDMSLVGLEPVGSATLIDGYDTLVLKNAERAALTEISDSNQREFMRDFFIDQAFRRDVFARDAHRLSVDDQNNLMLASVFALTTQPNKIEYVLTSRAGRITFDKPAARGLVAALASGPRTLGEVVRERSIAPADVVASALLLCASGQMQPARSDRAPVNAFNATVLGRLNGPEEIGYFAMPFGTTMPVNDMVREILANGATSDADPSWQDYLAVHGCRTIPLDPSF